ncbi:MAG: SIMPL domain-containing protein [Chloroflexota bacterium]|nr:SIMPL domain-containing protein [Chloroflexota bacterium]MDE3192376.1 SIMPL domain-containing protein [Chloroflexota bacterium]
MLSTFQKAVLGTIAGAAVLIALVISAKGSTTPVSLLTQGPSALSTPTGTGGVAPGLVTTGDGTAKVKPDAAIITVGAVAQAGTAADAQAQVAQRVDAILKRAKDLGIADKDTRNAGYSIQPQYAYAQGQAPRITGYQATQQVALTYRNVDNAGKALDALVQGDVAANTVSIVLTLDDPKQAQADARTQAIQDARAKADAMAKTAGITLGRIVAISDLSASAPSKSLYGPIAAPMPAGRDVASQVPTGDLDVEVRVQVQFEIQ